MEFPCFKLTDSTGQSTAAILPDYGFNCISWIITHSGEQVELLDTLPQFRMGTERPSSSGIPILFPFPNRIRDGQFVDHGKHYQLAKNHQNKNAIHGFVYDRPFRVIDHQPSKLTGRFQLSVDAPDRKHLWPADFILDVTYILEARKLNCEFTITNPETDVELPWGLGTHPYFKLPWSGLGNLADYQVQIDAPKRWVLVDNLPTGEIHDVDHQVDLRLGKSFKSCKFDDILTQIPTENNQTCTRILDTTQGLTLVQRADSDFKHIVIFTPVNRNAICLEPITAVTDAINLSKKIADTGWQTLQPGGQKTLTIALEVL